MLVNNKVALQTSNMVLSMAKIKKKLISDDLWSSIAAEVSSSDSSGKGAAGSVMAKDKRKNKLVSDDLPTSLVVEEEPVIIIQKDKSNKKDKKNRKSTNHNSQALEEDENFVHSETSDAAEATIVEVVKDIPTTRKDKLSARVRLTESTQPGFVRMALDQVELFFGADIILQNVSLCVSTGERVGLVGPNGAGKSTVLKVLAGELEANGGEVEKSALNLRVAFLRQEFFDSLTLTNTLKQELLGAFTAEQQILRDIEACEGEIARVATIDSVSLDAALNNLQKLQEKARLMGAYNLEPKLLKVMDSMGFSRDDGELLVSSFSGGWKMRIGLAKILTMDPNILLLDEPTNHMDLDSVIWLENFLKIQSIPMLIVSHGEIPSFLNNSPICLPNHLLIVFYTQIVSS
jgi:ABC-type multidrug transport system ATPase subunit